ncbi:ABC transporter permease [Streptomyces achromogenes]|uniref:ABC transporter permease n=1 Tax=Streptomyces achromogenes TaxID=67255 RepID=UPI003701BB3F
MTAARVPSGAGHAGKDGVRQELRAVHALVTRDWLRLAANPTNTMLMLLQPLLFLLAFGGGLSALVPDSAVGGQYRAFLYPGILLMAIQAPAVSVGIRLITDRHSGNIRELLVTPARRSSLLCGICLGGCATATAQGAVLLALAPAGGLPYRPLPLAVLLAELALAAFTLTALALVPAVHTRRPETFSTLLALTSAPLLFGSGALVPLSTLPSWVTSAAALNPLAYATDLLHRTAGPTAAAGVHWGTWQPPPALEAGVLLLTAITALLCTARRFGRTDDMT